MREANTPGSDIVHSACVNLGIVNLAEKKYVDAIQLFQTCARSLATTPHPTEASSLCGQIDIGNCIALSFLCNESFRDAVRAVSKILFLNPAVLHNWFNLAYLHEVSALRLLKRQQRSNDMKGVIDELKLALSLFHSVKGLLEVFCAEDHVSTSCTLKAVPSGSEAHFAPSRSFHRTLTVTPDALRNVSCSLIQFEPRIVRNHEIICQVLNLFIYF